LGKAIRRHDRTDPRCCQGRGLARADVKMHLKGSPSTTGSESAKRANSYRLQCNSVVLGLADLDSCQLPFATCSRPMDHRCWLQSGQYQAVAALSASTARLTTAVVGRLMSECNTSSSSGPGSSNVCSWLSSKVLGMKCPVLAVRRDSMRARGPWRKTKRTPGAPRRIRSR
jgi:hypothetical protein